MTRFKLEQTMRWFGPLDPVSLTDIRQAGATGVVSALHHVANGHIWSPQEIGKRKAEIESAGLNWSVVESLPVHEQIKTRSGNFKNWIQNYQTSIHNLAAAGIRTICYNFMPLLDWTRTDLNYTLSSGAKALFYNVHAVRAFDHFILQRPGVDSEITPEIIDCYEYFKSLNESELQQLQDNILAGLPGAEEGYSLLDFKESLLTYQHIEAQGLQENLFKFLKEVIPTAEEAGIKMAIHPDDPPFPIFGLPRIVSTEQDLNALIHAVPSPANGITFCTGSLGVRKENDLPGMIRRLKDHIHFFHLRNIKRDDQGSFYESDHLDGVVPMDEVMLEIILLQQHRKLSLPMRPDHGHRILDDLNKKANPGYTAIGRLKGLAELRGLEYGLHKGMD